MVDESGQAENVYGIIGMHFDLSLFEKTIDPLLENEGSDYAQNIQYWIYSVKRTLADG